MLLQQAAVVALAITGLQHHPPLVVQVAAQLILVRLVQAERPIRASRVVMAPTILLAVEQVPVVGVLARLGATQLKVARVAQAGRALLPQLLVHQLHALAAVVALAIQVALVAQAAGGLVRLGRVGLLVMVEQ